MTEPIPIPRDLDQNAMAWFAELHTFDVGSEDYARTQASVAFALGYGLESMTQQNVEDLALDMGRLTMFAAMRDPESGYSPSYEDEYSLANFARTVARLLEARATDDHLHERELEASYFDTMTGALNERGRNRHLERRYGLGGRGGGEHARKSDDEGEPPEVAEGDLDLTNFKRINSLLGDHIGDAAIVDAYEEIEAALRLADEVMIARYRRGDEFEILLGNISPDDLDELNARLLNAQLAKVRNDRYIKTWKKIQSALDAAGPEAKQLTEVRMGGNKGDVRMLYINGKRIVPLRSIVVHSFAFARGQLGSWEDHANLQGRAQELNKARKDMLHQLMGGADRPATTG